MTEWNLVFTLWGVVVLLLMAAQRNFFNALKTYESSLWVAFGKPTASNGQAFFSTFVYVLTGRYQDSKSDPFRKACLFYRLAILLFIISGILVFGVWPLTWQ